MKEFVTHDVIRYIFEKPSDLEFVSGQATELSMEGKEWRPFTFVSRPDDLVLEFIIKTYPEHDGVTRKFSDLIPGDSVNIKDVFGTMLYEGEGIFIAAGAGITPFIPILRKLNEESQLGGNKLFFSNKEKKDIILEKEFREMFTSEDLIFVLTRGEGEGYLQGRMNEDFIREHVRDFNQKFYICGPKIFVKQIRDILERNGAKTKSLIFEGKK